MRVFLLGLTRTSPCDQTGITSYLKQAAGAWSFVIMPAQEGLFDAAIAFERYATAARSWHYSPVLAA